jgi:hypothetical protein
MYSPPAVEYRIEFSDGGHVTIETSGRADLATFIRYHIELVEDARFRPGMAILVDLSELDTRQLSGEDVRAVANDAVSRGDRIGPAAIAVVGSETATFGLARMWQAFIEGAPFRSKVFHTRDEATDWLRSSP